MRVDVITLFPDFIDASSRVGVVGRAADGGLISVKSWNPRDYATGNYRRVDERPFGGGPGMIMLNEPLESCLEAIREQNPQAPLIYLSPQGVPLTQAKVRELAAMTDLILLCGRYEGVDERFIDKHVSEEVSIGDYVLSGGELAAAVLIDAMGRVQEGALNHADSATQDSFENGLLDCPHYTRSDSYGTEGVPEVLLSGDHAKIARWRRQQSLGRTWLRRPDLLEKMQLSAADKGLLQAFIEERAAAKAKDSDS